MGLFSKILGTDSIDKIIDKGSDFIDDVIYTKDEKAENKNKLMDFYLEYQRTTSGQNIARRVLAIMMVSAYLTFALMGIVVFKFDSTWSTLVFSFVKELSLAVSLIIAFYFGSGLMRTYKNGK